MDSDTDGLEGNVEVSISMSGSYESVLSKLDRAADRPDELDPLLADVALLLETVQRTGGGTRSALAEALPSETAADLDAESVSETMRLLERYDLVALEGNTWKPGPAVPDQQ